MSKRQVLALNADVQVLVLNADMTILSIADLHRILKMYAKQKINVIETSGNAKIHPSVNFEGFPSVVSLINYVYVPYREINLTRKKIFQRDHYRCQYCGERLNHNTATIDHIVPKSKPDSPGNTWLNMVSSCIKCNNVKGNKSLGQSGLRLRRKPFAPKLEHFFLVKKEWKSFINPDEDEVITKESSSE